MAALKLYFVYSDRRMSWNLFSGLSFDDDIKVGSVVVNYKSWRRGRKMQFSNRQLQISDSKISIKSIKHIHFKFLYCICRKLEISLKFTPIFLHKEIVIIISPSPVALWCLPSGSLPSVAGLSRLLLHASETPCQRRRHQLSR